MQIKSSTICGRATKPMKTLVLFRNFHLQRYAFFKTTLTGNE